MCCFSKEVQKVSNTNIFARTSKDQGQYLVYSMQLSAKEELAMILPIPTPKKSKEDAVKFISLEKYPKFFEDMLSGFPAPRSKGDKSRGKDKEDDKKEKLKVVEVGAY